MIVGVPKEIKSDEYRVAMVAGRRRGADAGRAQGADPDAGPGPAAASRTNSTPRTARRSSATRGRGLEAGRPDREGEGAAARRVAADAGRADGLHLLPLRRRRTPDTNAVMKSGITAIAYETIRDAKGTLPLLTPMSEVAGRMSIQEGAKYLERPFDGRGHSAGRRAGCAAGDGVGHRGRGRRRERGPGRGRPGRERLHPRRQPRPPALPRRRDAAERHDGVQQPAQHPRMPAAVGPRDRRGPDSRERRPRTSSAART